MEAGHEPRGREESNVKDGEKEEAINQENGGEISRKVEMDLLNMFIQFSSVVQSCPTLCDPVNHSTPGLPVQLQLLESTQIHAIESMMPSNHLILCRPLLLLPSILPSIRVFPNESIIRTGWWPVLFKRSLIWAYWNQPPALILLMPFTPTLFFFFLATPLSHFYDPESSWTS